MITERTMQLGDWSLVLHPDTPKAVRNLIDGFATIVIMPTLVAEVDMSDAMLASARYAGVITRPGPYFRIGGYGLAFWLGTDSRAYGNGIPARAFTNWLVPAAVPFGSAIFAAIDDCGLDVGTTTDPSGGAYYPEGTSYHYAKHRVVLDAVCRWYDAEWRVNPDFTVDAARYDTLYGPPTNVVTRRPGGRAINGAGIEALIYAQADLWNYASRVVIRGQRTVGAYGLTSAVYRNPGTQWLSAVAEEDATDLDGDLDVAAQRLHGTLQHAHRTVTVTSETYDFAGVIPCGSRIYVYDPDNGVLAEPTVAANSVEWQGEHIKPLAFRALSVTWPVEDGMSVFVRRITGTGAFGTPEYVDLTPYVVRESGATRVEVGYDVSLMWRR